MYNLYCKLHILCTIIYIYIHNFQYYYFLKKKLTFYSSYIASSYLLTYCAFFIICLQGGKEVNLFKKKYLTVGNEKNPRFSLKQSRILHIF